MKLPSITTRDVLAVLVVGAGLVFAGIAQVSGKPIDAGTFGLAALVVGYYFKDKVDAVSSKAEPLAEPYAGDAEG